MPDVSILKRLVLQDGTILENCECGLNSREIWCFLKDVTLIDVLQHFSDPSKYSKIVFEMESKYYVDVVEYSGLEDMISVLKNDQDIDVRLIGQKIETKEYRRYKETIKDGDENNGTVYNQDQNQP